MLKELIVSEGGKRVNYGTYISYINKFTLARGMLLYRRKSILYEKDDRPYTRYAIGNLPAYFSDSIVYYPVTCSDLAFWPDRFFYSRQVVTSVYLTDQVVCLWCVAEIVHTASHLLF